MSKKRADRPVAPDADILVPISVGELVDKITILQIKAERIGNRDQVANVRRELAALQAVAITFKVTIRVVGQACEA